MKIQDEVGLLRQQYPYAEFAFRFVFRIEAGEEDMEAFSTPLTEQEFIDRWDGVSDNMLLIRAEYSLSWADEDPWYVL